MAPPRRRWFRFTLRALFVLTTACCVLAAAPQAFFELGKALVNLAILCVVAVLVCLVFAWPMLLVICYLAVIGRFNRRRHSKDPPAV